jgi:peptidoglycan/LPS O-acetylase OafA/YrhL
MSERITPSPPPRLLALDALRGLAALAVVFHHEAPLYGAEGWFPRAYLAVDFFFLLSGFVLTLAIEPRLKQGLGTKRFMMLRLARLWPVLACGVGLGALAYYGTYGAHRLPMLTLASLLLLPYPAQVGGLFRLDGPQWSVSYEVLGNLVHGLVLWRLPNRWLLGLSLACGALLLWQASLWGSFGMGDATRNWWGGFARLGFSYGLGVWMGRQWSQGGGRIAAHWHWLGAVALPLVLASAQFWPLGVVAGDALAVLLIFPPTLWLSAHIALGGPLARWADRLGRLSYPLYAIHGPVLILGALLVRQHAIASVIARPATLAVLFALALALAYSPLAKGIPVRLPPKRG